MVRLMQTKVTNIEMRFFPWQTNVNTNSWCNNILHTRLVIRNHQNEKKKTWNWRKIVFTGCPWNSSNNIWHLFIFHSHRSDEHIASPYNIHILYSNQVVRVNSPIIQRALPPSLLSCNPKDYSALYFWNKYLAAHLWKRNDLWIGRRPK